MSLSVRIRGGHGRPVVVLPWLGVDGGFTATALEPALRETPDLRRIYVDLPGAGRSNRCEPSSDAILELLADWLVTELGEQVFSLVGFSYGGYLATALADRFGTQVDRLLVVCGGLKIRPEQRDLSGILPSDAEAGWLDQVPVHLQGHFAQAIGVQTAVVGFRLAAALAKVSAGDDPFLAELRENYQLSKEPSLAALAQRITFVVGRRDRIAGFRDQFAACLLCPNADYVLFASAGHYLPFEVPDEFRAAAAAWIS